MSRAVVAADALVPVSTTCRVRIATLAQRRAPTPLLPTIQALTHAGDNDTDDSRVLQRKRLGLGSRGSVSRPDTALTLADHLLRNSSSEGSLPVMNRQLGGTPLTHSRACSSRELVRSRGCVGSSRTSTARATISRQRPGTALLEGVSAPVEIENDRLNTDIVTLYMQKGEAIIRDDALPLPCVFAGKRTGLFGGSRNLSRSGSRSELGFIKTELDFLTEAAETKLLIDDLRERQEVFNPREQSLNGPLGKPRQGDSSAGPKECLKGADEEESRQERLELYKMCKKVEEPVPSLVPDGMTAQIALARMRALDSMVDKTYVEYNMSNEAMQLCLPWERQEILNDRSNQKRFRADQAHKSREYLNGVRTDECAQQLHHKELRAMQNVSEKKKNDARRMAIFRFRHATERWLTISVICGFFRDITWAVSVSRLSTQEEPRSLASLGVPSKRLRQSGLWREALLLKEVLTQDQTKRNFQLLANMWSSRLAVKRSNQQCQIIHKCLCKWRTAQVFRVLRQYLDQVRRVQSWWRTTRQELRDIRDRISRRWENLERNHLVQALREQNGLPQLGMTGSWSSGAASFGLSVTHSSTSSSQSRRQRSSIVQLEEMRRIHERIEAEAARQMIPQARRLQFIRDELRSRRKRLLPSLKVYRDDLMRWRELQGARHSLQERPKQAVDRIFQMPPTRPSYLPVGHLSSCEGIGEPCQRCSKWCPGERGDEEIMSWRKMLKASSSADCGIEKLKRTVSTSSSFFVASGPRNTNARQPTQFGAVSDDDLRRYCIDWRAMPGVTRRVEGYEPMTNL